MQFLLEVFLISLILAFPTQYKAFFPTWCLPQLCKQHPNYWLILYLPFKFSSALHDRSLVDEVSQPEYAQV